MLCGVLWTALSCLLGAFYRGLFWQPQVMFRKVVLALFSSNADVNMMNSLFRPFEYVSFNDSQFSPWFCSILVNHSFGPFWCTFWFSGGFVYSSSGYTGASGSTLQIVSWDRLALLCAVTGGGSDAVFFWSLPGALVLTDLLVSANCRSLLILLVTKHTLHLSFCIVCFRASHSLSFFLVM